MYITVTRVRYKVTAETHKTQLDGLKGDLFTTIIYLTSSTGRISVPQERENKSLGDKQGNCTLPSSHSDPGLAGSKRSFRIHRKR